METLWKGILLTFWIEYPKVKIEIRKFICPNQGDIDVKVHILFTFSIDAVKNIVGRVPGASGCCGGHAMFTVAKVGKCFDMILFRLWFFPNWGVSGISGCSFGHALLTIAEIRPDKSCMYQPSLYLTLSGKSNTSIPP